jgi:hypothetical protein
MVFDLVMHRFNMCGQATFLSCDIITMLALVVSDLVMNSFYMQCQVSFLSCGIVTILTLVVFDLVMHGFLSGQFSELRHNYNAGTCSL